MNVDLTEAILVARVQCPTCDGDGNVMSDDWQGFVEWRSRRPTMSPEDEDDLVERYFIEVCDYNAVPPMGETCGPCNGTGKQDVDVPVKDLLELVFEHVDRPVVSESELDELVDRVKVTITEAAHRSNGLADGLEVGTWLRAVQEGAEALRSFGELRRGRIER